MATDSPNQPAFYTIHAQGVLDVSWTDRMSGMAITVSHDPDAPAITTLTGPLADQATLESVLTTLYTLGLPLLSVESSAIPT